MHSGRRIFLLKTVFLVCAVLECLQTNANALKCATPNSTEGECIFQKDCPLLLKMSEEKPLTPETIRYLHRSQCNYDDLEPKVCCPISDKPTLFQLPKTHLNQSRSDEIDISVENRFKPDDGLPGLDQCGKQGYDNRIFNGEFTAIDEFPWMALLEYKKRRVEGHGFACGGALITDRHILTAAHCVSGQNEQVLGGLIGVRLGEHNIETDVDCDDIYPTDCADPAIDMKIKKKFIHPNYNEDSMDQLNDIAVLELDRTVNFTDFIRPICLSKKLPSERIHNPGHEQYVAGWGQTEFHRNSPVKKKLKIRLIDETTCSSKYQPFNIRLSKRQLCAGGERNKDSCSGDSGGPLMVIAQTGKKLIWYMTGIVSIGPTPCATNGIPGIYTKVYDYLDWILEQIKN